MPAAWSAATASAADRGGPDGSGSTVAIAWHHLRSSLWCTCRRLSDAPGRRRDPLRAQCPPRRIPRLSSADGDDRHDGGGRGGRLGGRVCRHRPRPVRTRHGRVRVPRHRRARGERPGARGACGRPGQRRTRVAGRPPHRTGRTERTVAGAGRAPPAQPGRSRPQPTRRERRVGLGSRRVCGARGTARLVGGDACPAVQRRGAGRGGGRAQGTGGATGPARHGTRCRHRDPRRHRPGLRERAHDPAGGGRGRRGRRGRNRCAGGLDLARPLGRAGVPGHRGRRSRPVRRGRRPDGSGSGAAPGCGRWRPPSSCWCRSRHPPRWPGACSPSAERRPRSRCSSGCDNRRSRASRSNRHSNAGRCERPRSPAFPPPQPDHGFSQAQPARTGRTAVRGLFSGGTLCYEAQLLIGDLVGPVYSNEPLRPELGLPAPNGAHVLLDLGAEEYTRGRAAPDDRPERTTCHVAAAAR